MSATSQTCLQLRFYRGLYAILYLYFGSSDQLINLSQCHNRSVDLFSKPKQVVFGSIYYLKQYLAVVVFQFLYSICISSQLKCILMFTVCFDFATVVALHFTTSDNLNGSWQSATTLHYIIQARDDRYPQSSKLCNFYIRFTSITHLHLTDSKPS